MNNTFFTKRKLHDIEKFKVLCLAQKLFEIHMTYELRPFQQYVKISINI